MAFIKNIFFSYLQFVNVLYCILVIGKHGKQMLLWQRLTCWALLGAVGAGTEQRFWGYACPPGRPTQAALYREAPEQAVLLSLGTRSGQTSSVFRQPELTC